MLRCVPLAPIARPLVARSAFTSVACAGSRRAFSVSWRANSEKPKLGSEGPHNKDVPATTPRPLEPVSSSGPPTGDWVLFHPVYSKEEVRAFEDVRHEPKTLSDRAAQGFVWLLRHGFDIVSRYKHKEIPAGSNMSLKELREGGYTMDDHQWLNRILFLESIAGVPGMVGATCRHLRSLRLMRRDAGWIHTLLEEAENERMHLMTFMTLRNPGIFFRALILGAQGVFYNLFFFSYLFSPKTAHRFVGLLEEQACWTYTCAIEELERGRIPEWADKKAPAIAIDYWRLAPDATLLDVLYAVRADETTHRFVNHTLANLNPKTDPNPFAIREPDMYTKGVKPGFTRGEAESYIQESISLVDKASEGHTHYGSVPEPPAQHPTGKPNPAVS